MAAVHAPRALALLAACALVAGCGEKQEPAATDQTPTVAERSQKTYERAEASAPPQKDRKRACALVRTADVRAIAAEAGARPVGTLRRVGKESDELASCRWHAAGVAISVAVDRAREAEKRYWYRQSEQQQFYADDPKRTPVTVTGVGQDESYGGGAFWMPGTHRLLAVRDDTMLIIGFEVRGAGQRASRRGAADLGRATFRGLFGRKKAGRPTDLSGRPPAP